MNANEMTPSCAIEKATPVDLAMTPVAAAVPGPQMTSAAVPRNSATSFLGRVTSDMDPPFGRGWGICGDVVRLYRTMFRRVSGLAATLSIATFCMEAGADP